MRLFNAAGGTNKHCACPFLQLQAIRPNIAAPFLGAINLAHRRPPPTEDGGVRLCTGARNLRSHALFRTRWTLSYCTSYPPRVASRFAFWTSTSFEAGRQPTEITCSVAASRRVSSVLRTK